jgi:hypothetical protein
MFTLIKQKINKEIVRLTRPNVALSDVIINQLERLFSLILNFIYFFKCLQSYVLCALLLRPQDKVLSAYLIDQIFFITWSHVDQTGELNSFGGQFIRAVRK